MRKIDFLNELYYYLSPLPEGEKNEIIADFRAHFREGEAEGKTESQICNELGAPIECAKQYVGEAAFEQNMKKSKKQKRGKVFWVIALLWNILQTIISVPVTLAIFLVAALMCVFFAFVVPAIGSVAFLVFAISITLAVFLLGVMTLLWAIIEIKECVRMINK